MLKNIAPELMESSDTVYAQSDLNIEEIMKLNPDVILYNAGIFARRDPEGRHSSIGFATVGASTEADPLERYEEWLKLLEDVFDEPGKTEAFVAAGDEIVADVEARIADIPESDRPSALILWKYSDGVPAGLRKTGTLYLLDEASGRDRQSAGSHRFCPDQHGTGLQLGSGHPLPRWPRPAAPAHGECAFRQRGWCRLLHATAVQNGRVYNTTLGMWNWFTPNPDAPLVLARPACNTYPDAFADYPLGDTIKEYYKTWYGYDVTDDEMEEMLLY